MNRITKKNCPNYNYWCDKLHKNCGGCIKEDFEYDSE